MKLYSLEEVLDGHFGKIGTPERDSFEKEVTDAVNAFTELLDILVCL